MAATLCLLAAAGGLTFFTGAAASEPSRVPPPTADDIAYGPADAELTVIEYSDFQCPFCAQYAVWLGQLRRQYGDRVRFVYRFFPLARHPYATVAAKAAYAAHLQGKFWEMHDLLYEHQVDWTAAPDPRASFVAYAEQLGLDLDAFRADMDAPATTAFIAREAAAGEKAGVSHTPWFVIGGRSVLPRSKEDFDELIGKAL